MRTKGLAWIKVFHVNQKGLSEIILGEMYHRFYDKYDNY